MVRFDLEKEVVGFEQVLTVGLLLSQVFCVPCLNHQLVPWHVVNIDVGDGCCFLNVTEKYDKITLQFLGYFLGPDFSSANIKLLSTLYLKSHPNS